MTTRIHPALAEHAVRLENERLRGLLREAAITLDGWRNTDELDELAEKITAALSQQAEPKCCAPTEEELRLLNSGEYTPQELWGDYKPSCPKCAKPAPAQDEQEAFEAHMRLGGYSNPEKHPDGSYVSCAMELFWQGWKARAARPAQTEQPEQPEQGDLKPLLNAGAALSNIAFNLAQRPGVTLDQIVCDTLSSARKSWDEARAALSTQGSSKP